MQINSANDLIVYQKAYKLAMSIFKVSKSWPSEEKYSLTDQIRRSSRSVCANLKEAWAKRRYKAQFINKITDADAENSETQTWLDFARDCDYLSKSIYDELNGLSIEIGKMFGKILIAPEPFIKNN